MSDSFNPQEILSRLRGNKNPGNTNPNPHQNANSSLSQPQSSQVNANITQNSKSISLNTNKTMKTPASLTLTPSQRQDNLAIRTELENEIKKLQEENNRIKAENKKIKSEKEDLEKQLNDFKIKSEEVISKLRGKLAAIALNSTPSMIEGTGRMYPSNPQTPPPPPPTSSNHSPANPVPFNGSENFREPTFSELMRRSTSEHHKFVDSLRKSSNLKLSSRAKSPNAIYTGSSQAGNISPNYNTPNIADNSNGFSNTVQSFSNYTNGSTTPNVSNSNNISSRNYNIDFDPNMNNSYYQIKRKSTLSNSNGNNNMNHNNPDSFSGHGIEYLESEIPVIEIDLSK